MLERGAFVVTFGPCPRELPLGDWWVYATFRLGQQSQVRARKFMLSLPPAERELYERVQRRAPLRVGSEAEIAEQRARLQAAIVGAGRRLMRAVGRVGPVSGW